MLELTGQADQLVLFFKLGPPRNTSVEYCTGTMQLCFFCGDRWRKALDTNLYQTCLNTVPAFSCSLVLSAVSCANQELGVQAFASADFTDMTIVCDKREFHCHKFMLAARSVYTVNISSLKGIPCAKIRGASGRLRKETSSLFIPFPLFNTGTF